eukprot:1175605-Prymnesium_polylepis.1
MTGWCCRTGIRPPVDGFNGCESDSPRVESPPAYTSQPPQPSPALGVFVDGSISYSIKRVISDLASSHRLNCDQGHRT